MEAPQRPDFWNVGLAAPGFLVFGALIVVLTFCTLLFRLFATSYRVRLEGKQQSSRNHLQAYDSTKWRRKNPGGADESRKQKKQRSLHADEEAAGDEEAEAPFSVPLFTTGVLSRTEAGGQPILLQTGHRTCRVGEVLRAAWLCVLLGYPYAVFACSFVMQRVIVEENSPFRLFLLNSVWSIGVCTRAMLASGVETHHAPYCTKG